MKTVLLALVAVVVVVVALAAVKSRGEIGRYRDLSRM
jgi:ABC-type transporter Mla subunit MlaD